MNIIFILDRSGSMHNIWEDAIGSFNSFVATQAQDNPDDKLTFILFDHEYVEVYRDKPLNEVEIIDGQVYTPRGATALLDAVGRTINSTTEKSLVVIMTDGHENASEEFGRSTIQNLIKEKEDNDWTFMYLGANQDSFDEASNLGIMKGMTNTVNYQANKAGITTSFVTINDTVNLTRDRYNNEKTSEHSDS